MSFVFGSSRELERALLAAADEPFLRPFYHDLARALAGQTIDPFDVSAVLASVYAQHLEGSAHPWSAVIPIVVRALIEDDEKRQGTLAACHVTVEPFTHEKMALEPDGTVRFFDIAGRQTPDGRLEIWRVSEPDQPQVYARQSLSDMFNPATLSPGENQLFLAPALAVLLCLEGTLDFTYAVFDVEEQLVDLHERAIGGRLFRVRVAQDCPATHIATASERRPWVS